VAWQESGERVGRMLAEAHELLHARFPFAARPEYRIIDEFVGGAEFAGK